MYSASVISRLQKTTTIALFTKSHLIQFIAKIPPCNAGEDEGNQYYKTTEQQNVRDERFIGKVDRKLMRVAQPLRRIYHKRN